MLETYSGIPTEDVTKHVHTIVCLLLMINDVTSDQEDLFQRDKAWAIRAYPTIGLGAYLDPALPKHPLYETIVSRLQSESISFLEIGVMLGSDLRALVSDGAPSEKLIAVDIVSFWELGYEMFRDGRTFKCKFVEADMMGRNGPLQPYQHSIDIIYISQVLHQWSYERQVEACHRLVDLSRVGCWIVGNQIGGAKGRLAKPFANMPAVWRHDVESWRQMWDRVERESGTKWETETTLMTFTEFGLNESDAANLGEDARFLIFTVKRIA